MISNISLLKSKLLVLIQERGKLDGSQVAAHTAQLLSGTTSCLK